MFVVSGRHFKLNKMSTLPIIFIVLAIIAMIIKIAKWISTGESQLSEIMWIGSAILWCINSQLR
jgi:hypothetical protein